MQGGEYYKTNCPCSCGSRKRLQFHYLWGQPDEISGKPLLHIVICFNDEQECVADRDSQLDLLSRVFPFGSVPPIDHRIRGDAITGDTTAAERIRRDFPKIQFASQIRRCLPMFVIISTIDGSILSFWPNAGKFGIARSRLILRR